MLTIKNQNRIVKKLLLAGTLAAGYCLSSGAALAAVPAGPAGPAGPTTPPPPNGSGLTSTELSNSLKQNPIVKDLNIIVNFLSVGVGIVVIADLIIGGIQYSMAGGNPDAVGKAKQRITNGAIAFIAYLLIFSFLQWVIPGGVFNGSP